MGIWVIGTLAVSLGLTIVLEETFGWMWGVRNRWDMTLVVLVNVLTNPAVVYLYYMNMIFVGWNRILVTVFLEMAAAAAEGLRKILRVQHRFNGQDQTACIPKGHRRFEPVSDHLAGNLSVLTALNTDLERTGT